MTGKRNRSNTQNIENFTRPTKSLSSTNCYPSSNRTKTVDELLGMSKEQLKNECRKRGQKTSGNKKELLARLGSKAGNMTGGTKRKSANTELNGTHVKSPPKSKADHQRKEKEKLERESIVLWRKPFLTVEYFCREMFIWLTMYSKKMLANKKYVSVVLISVLSLYILVNSKGPHHNLVQGIYKKLLWCLYWIGLGILSSVGLGTGLHTFLLYLGPHIAQVTLAAYECESLNFPEPPYPDEIICPSERDPLSITIFSIMAKVRLEAMCWGAGTALGELPPYFMAKASRLSGLDPDDDEDDEFRALEQLEKKKHNKDNLSFVENGKLLIGEFVQKAGFLGILAFASIPNPLFDLAGITCGHFLVPFWTFFGATLIGKAVIKMHIQKLFVIIAFNEILIETAIEKLNMIPIIGVKLQAPFKAFLDGQKRKLHRKPGAGVTDAGGNILGSIFEKFVMAMILYFIISLINSIAQAYHKRLRGKHSRYHND